MQGSKLHGGSFHSIMYFKTASAKWRQTCLGLNVLDFHALGVSLIISGARHGRYILPINLICRFQYLHIMVSLVYQALGIISIIVWISNLRHCFIWDVITRPWISCNGDIVKPPLKLCHGWLPQFDMYAITYPFHNHNAGLANLC